MCLLKVILLTVFLFIWFASRCFIHACCFCNKMILNQLKRNGTSFSYRSPQVFVLQAQTAGYSVAEMLPLQGPTPQMTSSSPGLPPLNSASQVLRTSLPSGHSPPQTSAVKTFPQAGTLAHQSLLSGNCPGVGLSHQATSWLATGSPLPPPPQAIRFLGMTKCSRGLKALTSRTCSQENHPLQAPKNKNRLLLRICLSEGLSHLATYSQLKAVCLIENSNDRILKNSPNNHCFSYFQKNRNVLMKIAHDSVHMYIPCIHTFITLHLFPLQFFFHTLSWCEFYYLQKFNVPFLHQILEYIF